MVQLVRLQLNGGWTEPIQAHVVITATAGGGSAIGELPAPTAVVNDYQDWRATYLSLNRVSRVIKPMSAGEHAGLIGGYVSDPQVCQQKANQFLKRFNRWLRASDFVSIRDTLIRAFDSGDKVRFVICTNSPQLQQLPWPLWDFLSLYSEIEVAVSSQTYHTWPNRLPFPIEPDRVKVLAILGDSSDINVEKDRQFLSRLPHADVTFLPMPKRSALHDELWNRPVDILFFAGHSRSQGRTGTLRLNAKEELSLEGIQHALGRIAKRGLTLAIFNSCDGLGLAKYLSQAIAPSGIPYIIVMREAVPDAVAQAFLKYFLSAFSRGDAFHTAVRSARERLENSSEVLPPYGDWMPVIWQNPLVEPPVWPQPAFPSPAGQLSRFKQLTKGALVAFGVTALVLGIRFLGGLQTLELRAYDSFMRARPADAVDQKILIVTITERELDREELASISDADLEQLLERVYQAQPSVVGLDLFRDAPIDPTYTQLKQYFADGERLVTLCGVGDTKGKKEEVKPSPDADLESVGFSDAVRDKDLTLRRHLLAFDPPAGQCNTDLAFSTLVAYNYLQQRGIALTTNTAERYWMWGRRIPLLGLHQGAYHSADMAGDTILINYRVPQKNKEPFKLVTLSQVMTGEVRPELIKDRIVIIGTSASSLPDRAKTPFLSTQGSQLEIPGVVFQAHLVSQLVDVAQGDRPLLRPWHPLADGGWILLWASVGVLIVRLWPRPVYTMAISGVAVVGLSTICWIGFVSMGIWIAWVPSVISLIGASVADKISHKGDRLVEFRDRQPLTR